jgi:SAM-dependent methyltransferase
MFPSFAHRSHKLERLDTGDYTREEYSLWLREMHWINRWLGDAHALRKELRKVMDDHPVGQISVLDVGAGSGELLKVANETMGQRTKLLVGAELAAPAAGEIASRSAEFGVVAVQCDAKRLPFSERSFDVVICSLFLHHLTEKEGVDLLDEMARVARLKVIAIDLHRHPMAYFFYRAFVGLLLQPFTLEDGSLSILRSYRPPELQAVANATRLREPRVGRSFPFRLILSASP